MSEEVKEAANDGTWSGLKKTIIGTLTTVVAGGGVWVSTLLFGGHSEEKAETKTEQAAPVINLNVDNSSKNTNTASGGGTTTIIHEKEVVKEKAAEPAKKEEDHKNDPW